MDAANASSAARFIGADRRNGVTPLLGQRVQIGPCPPRVRRAPGEPFPIGLGQHPEDKLALEREDFDQLGTAHRTPFIKGLQNRSLADGHAMGAGS
jgi:hypothetical protein